MITGASVRIPWHRPTWARVRLGCGASLALLVLVGGIMVGLGPVFAVLGGMILLTWAALRWPVPTAIFFVAFTPVNRLALVLFNHFIGLGGVTRIAQLWRDGLLALLLARILHDVLTSRERRWFGPLDLAVVGFLALSAVYLVWPGYQDLDIMTRIEGFRTDASFLFAYLVGRNLRLGEGELRWLVLAIVPGAVLVGAVALWQLAEPAQAERVFTTLGVADFTGLQGGDVSTAVERARDIPGLNLTRATSLMFGDLALAFFQVLTIALAAALFLLARGARNTVAAALFLLLMAATMAATLTRSGMLAVIPGLLLALVITRAFGRTLLLGLLGAAAGAVALIVDPARLDQVRRLFDLANDGSSQSHALFLQRSFDVIGASPIGHGLGTAGSIGTRFLGEAAIDNENWYLLLATEIGVLAGLLYLAINLGVIGSALLAYRRVTDRWLRIVCLTVAAGALSYLILGNVLHAWDNTVVSMVFWLFAGIAVRAPRLQEGGAVAPLPPQAVVLPGREWRPEAGSA